MVTINITCDSRHYCSEMRSVNRSPTSNVKKDVSRSPLTDYNQDSRNTLCLQYNCQTFVGTVITGTNRKINLFSMTLIVYYNYLINLSLSPIFSLDWMFQYCVVFKVLFGEELPTHWAFCSATPSVNVLNNGILIIVMTTNFTLHGFYHLLQC